MVIPAEINFGFLMLPLQLLDMCGPMDILSGTRASYLSSIGYPADVVAAAGNINFHYIGTGHETTTTMTTFTNFTMVPTCTIYDCPKLDYLLIGGPDPQYAKNLPADVKTFIIERAAEVKTVFTTCTGGLVLAATGLLDGQPATTNHVVMRKGIAEEMFPNVKWNSTLNWVISEDGKIWTGAGAVAGMDMIAHWVREQFGDGVWEASCDLLDYDPRDVNGKLIAMN